MKNVLLINAHQFHEGIAPGRLNKTLTGVIREAVQARGQAFQQTDIEAGYVVDDEVRKHLWADLIILQSPVYWFGSPWIHKKYLDEVFTAGMLQGRFITSDGRTRDDPSRQYGSGGLLQGKQYLLSLTWNAPAEAFGDPQQGLFAGKTVDDVFAAHTATYAFCGVSVLPSFSCHDVFKAPEVAADIDRLQQRLAALL